MSDVENLPIAGRTVDEVAYSRGGLWLRFWMPGDEYGLHLEGPFQLVGSGGVTRELDPRAPDVIWFSLVGRKVLQAQATVEGSLQIRFSDGTQLTVPSYRYEAWQLEGSNGELFVSVAGGGIGVWSADEEFSKDDRSR